MGGDEVVDDEDRMAMRIRMKMGIKMVRMRIMKNRMSMMIIGMRMMPIERIGFEDENKGGKDEDVDQIGDEDDGMKVRMQMGILMLTMMRMRMITRMMMTMMRIVM